MHQIDLHEVTQKGKVPNLLGRTKGERARSHFNLDYLDQVSGTVKVVIPDNLYAIAPSYFQGLFSNSVRHFGSAGLFLEHYLFPSDPILMAQINRGIELSLMDRTSIL